MSPPRPVPVSRSPMSLVTPWPPVVDHGAVEGPVVAPLEHLVADLHPLAARSAQHHQHHACCQHLQEEHIICYAGCTVSVSGIRKIVMANLHLYVGKTCKLYMRNTHKEKFKKITITEIPNIACVLMTDD